MTAFDLGKEFARGVAHYVGGLLLILVALSLVLALARNLFRVGIDDTDKDAWHRSGLRVYTDHKTGVQYLSDGKGGFTPRITKERAP